MFGRTLARSVLNSILSWYGFLQARNYEISKTLVVAGSPRSGTTWLAEILSSIPGTSILMEPLNLNWVPEARAAGFNWRTQIAPDDDWPQAEDFMRRVLTGQVLNTHTISHASLVRILTTRSWIVKFVRANRLLEWMSKRFPIQPPILLIRHPCAIVASQISYGWSDTSEEALAATWCQDYYVPLSSPRPHPWILVSYEKLVREREAELGRVFHSLCIEVPEGAVESLGVPSATTRQKSPIVMGKDPLAGWKESLTEDQVMRILGVVSEYGLDFYGEDLEPDYDRLNDYSGVGTSNS